MAEIPAAICIMASVMMKDGMPMRVTPNAVTRPSKPHAISATITATGPGIGRF